MNIETKNTVVMKKSNALSQKKALNVQGHKVTLSLVAEANYAVSERIKQMLLGSYFAENAFILCR